MPMITLTKMPSSKFEIPRVFQNVKIPRVFQAFQSCKHLVQVLDNLHWRNYQGQTVSSKNLKRQCSLGFTWYRLSSTAPSVQVVQHLHMLHAKSTVVSLNNSLSNLSIAVWIYPTFRHIFRRLASRWSKMWLSITNYCSCCCCCCCCYCYYYYYYYYYYYHHHHHHHQY